jgi:putative cardiolipin synthase
LPTRERLAAGATAWALFACLFCAGCATLDTTIVRSPSHASPVPYDESPVGRAFERDLARRPGQSACLLLDEGSLALFQRSVLADVATSSIDLQTYIYEDDPAGVILMERLFLAAERGVRVRLLIDDNGLASDASLPLLLDGHPGIEVRIFNPFHLRARWSRPFQYLFEFRRLNRRMHNKLFIVDGTAAIVGGRNVGGNYFDQDEDRNFTDTDVLLIGPAARAGAEQFDEYWNSDFAWPASAVPSPLDDARRAELMQDYREQLSRFDERRTRYFELRRTFIEALEKRRLDVHFGGTKLVADPPEKVDPDRAPQVSPVVTALQAEWDRADREILIASAYLVPGPGIEARMNELDRRDVEVTFLTNSLASNDVVAVHAGYAKRRRALLEGGARVFEYQKFANTPERRDTPASGASLHSKMMVFDRMRAWVGSFNLDPRSVELNTEVAVIIDSSSFAAELARRFEHDIAPQRSWQVELVHDPATSRETLEWQGVRDGEPLTMHHEPDASPMRRIAVRLMRLIPGLDRLL